MACGSCRGRGGRPPGAVDGDARRPGGARPRPRRAPAAARRARPALESRVALRSLLVSSCCDRFCWRVDEYKDLLCEKISSLSTLYSCTPFVIATLSLHTHAIPHTLSTHGCHMPSSPRARARIIADSTRRISGSARCPRRARSSRSRTRRAPRSAGWCPCGSGRPG